MLDVLSVSELAWISLHGISLSQFDVIWAIFGVRLSWILDISLVGIFNQEVYINTPKQTDTL